MPAFFTAVSAVCVTGLAVVDTSTYWSGFGQLVIMLLIQIGGFGMMTAATLLGLMVNRSLRLKTKLIAQLETHSLGLGDISSVVKLVFIVTLASELIIAAFIASRLHFTYGDSWTHAAWSGLFHAISAFNNAGFSIYPDSVMSFSSDAWMLLPLMSAIVLGGIGFPVLYDLRRKVGYRNWTLHSKLTLIGTAALLLIGFLGVLGFEWSNPKTLGTMQMADKLLSAAFASVSVRTAGFNSIDIGALTQESWTLHYFLMFVGGGSAGTAGGVKVGTTATLIVLVYAVVRGHDDSEVFGRRISLSAQRQAIAVLVLSMTAVMLATVLILCVSNFSIGQVAFEVVSAFGTVGLSTGITADLPVPAQLVLTFLMYFGRVGTITFATSLALGERHAMYRYPEEHPIVG